jgi:hypothetical protein
MRKARTADYSSGQEGPFQNTGTDCFIYLE